MVVGDGYDEKSFFPRSTSASQTTIKHYHLTVKKCIFLDVRKKWRWIGVAVADYLVVRNVMPTPLIIYICSPSLASWLAFREEGRMMVCTL